MGKDLREMAETLYDMCIDMDYGDYGELRKIEVNGILESLKELSKNECSYLLDALEIITQKYGK